MNQVASSVGSIFILKNMCVRPYGRACVCMFLRVCVRTRVRAYVVSVRARSCMHVCVVCARAYACACVCCVCAYAFVNECVCCVCM